MKTDIKESIYGFMETVGKYGIGNPSMIGHLRGKHYRIIEPSDFIIIGGAAWELHGHDVDAFDIDMITRIDHNYIVQILDNEGVKCKDRNRLLQGPVITEFDYKGVPFDLMNEDAAKICVKGRLRKSVPVELHGMEINVRPAELLLKDIDKASIGIRNRLSNGNASISDKKRWKKYMERLDIITGTQFPETLISR